MVAVTVITQLNVGPGSGPDTFFVTGTVGMTGALTVGDYTLPATDGTTGRVLCTNGSGVLSWGAGGGGSTVWADGTNPYITPCNGCGICITEATAGISSTIVQASNCFLSDNYQGASSLSLINVACVCGTTCVLSPVGHFSTCSNSPLHCGTNGCFTNVYGSTVISGGRLNIGGSSACALYVNGNGIYAGTLEITYADTTCVCGSRLVKIPVGTNCY